MLRISLVLAVVVSAQFDFVPSAPPVDAAAKPADSAAQSADTAATVPVPTVSNTAVSASLRPDTASLVAPAVSLPAAASGISKGRTLLTVRTVPYDAELYLNRPRTLYRFYDVLTPAPVAGMRKGLHKVLLFKPGYRDTTLEWSILDSINNEFDVALSPETNDAALKAQKLFVKQRMDKRKAQWIWGASVAMGVAGLVVLSEAFQDRDKAEGFKRDLEYAAIRTGAQYEGWLSGNKQATDDYHSNYRIATTLLGLTAIGGAAGFYFWF